jgi:hypothetical protein
MQPTHVYEYAVIRIVPVVEREEFVNAGVVVFCKSASYIGMKYTVPENKIRTLAPQADLQEIREHLEAFSKITAGRADGGPIARLDEAERFRWLTAVRSASIQTSRPHTGMCDDLDKTVEELFLDFS